MKRDFRTRGHTLILPPPAKQRMQIHPARMTAGRAVSVMKRNGRIDVLINNAGMVQTGQPLEGKTVRESSYADWCRQIEITLHTGFLMTRAVLPVMTQRKYGRIVNVSSVTGPLVSNRGSGAYGAGKAAMDGMMRAVALETALDGITINGVAPGGIGTASSTEVARME